MKSSIKLLGIVALMLLCLAGCATHRVIVVQPVPPPVVSYDIDYWCDAFQCYYYDDVYNQYFWWNGGVRIWMGAAWLPRPEWRHHDSLWRNRDRGWRNGDWDRGRGPVHAAPGRGPRPPVRSGPGRGRGPAPGRGGRGGGHRGR